MRYYTASKSRSQGRKYYSIIFRHPAKKDSSGKSGLRIRRGLNTCDAKRADELVDQMNDLLKCNLLWNIDAKHIAERLYDSIVISAFYDVLEIPTESTFLIVFESGLGKGWELVKADGVDDALEKFKEKEPDIFKLCHYPGGEIRVGREEMVIRRR